MRILLWVVGVLALALPARVEAKGETPSTAQGQASKATAKRTVDPGKQAVEAARKKAAAAKNAATKKAAAGPAGKAKGPGAAKADGNSALGSAARRALLSGKTGLKAKAKDDKAKAKKPMRAKS